MSNHYVMCKYDDATGTYIPLEVRPYIDDFQAGASSREAEVARLREINSKLCKKSNWYVVHTARLEEERDQLRTQSNVLRGALEEAMYSNSTATAKQKAADALAYTPEQSLAAYRNKVIEAFVNEFSRHVGGDGEFWLHELQDFAMKEQP